MQFAFVVAAQLIAAVSTQQPMYSSLALREIVQRAAARNRSVPAELVAYGAHVESEMSLLLGSVDGAEVPLSIEQVQNNVQWQRDGDFTQQVTAYRARAAGPGISAFAVLRKPWTIPTLYGNRLTLFFGQDSSLGPLRDADVPVPHVPPSARATLAVHPFSDRRDAVYTFSGGDTVAVLHTSERAITIVRVLVEPRPEQPQSPVVVFRGEINLDAELSEIVHLRGQFITLGKRGPQRQRLAVLPLTVNAYVDLESALIGGRYWLPRHQRIERHVSVSGLAQGNSVFRIVSHFTQHRITERDELASLSSETLLGALGIVAVDATLERRLTVATGDPLTPALEWALPLGEATKQLKGSDFADLNGSSGAPRISWRTQRLADLVHFNRVEGWSTGAGMEAKIGDWAPRMRLRANGTWAWTEQALRGRIEALYGDPGTKWKAGVRLGRTLDVTNDFTASHDSGGSLLAALTGSDPYDYVERRAATLWAKRDVVPNVLTLAVESALADDRPARARLTQGLWKTGEPLPANRGIDPGTYARAAVLAEWNPGVVASPLTPGLGARLQHEAAVGEIAWQRSTLRVVTRHDVGDFALGVLADAGVLTGADVPPQQLFEVGGEPYFPGFAYKEFAGDRAVTTHWRGVYRLPFLRSPLRLLGCTCLTAPSPGVAVTLHGVRVWAAGATTMASIARLGSTGAAIDAESGLPAEVTPLSSATGGWRGSVELGVRLFGGAVTIGTVRVLDSGAPWRPSISIGQQW